MSRFSRRQPRPESPADCLSIEEFCARHRISKQFYYKLRAEGRGPTEIRLGSRVLISKEAAEDWRRRMQEAPPKEAPPKPAA